MINSYRDSSGTRSDTDWSLATIVKRLRKSREFTNMKREKQNSKEMKASAMKAFFETNAFYKNDVYTNSSTKKKLLKGWRLKVDDDYVQAVPEVPFVTDGLE